MEKKTEQIGIRVTSEFKQRLEAQAERERQERLKRKETN